ncbi:MAG: hypothetical protein ACI92E_002677, partial [Oceanicoccus sp.]
YSEEILLRNAHFLIIKGHSNIALRKQPLEHF